MAAMEGKVSPYSTEPCDKMDDRKVLIALVRSTLLCVEPFMLSVNETVTILYVRFPRDKTNTDCRSVLQ